MFSFGVGMLSVIVKVLEHSFGELNGLRQKFYFLFQGTSFFLWSDTFSFRLVGSLCCSFPLVVVAFVDAS